MTPYGTVRNAEERSIGVPARDVRTANANGESEERARIRGSIIGCMASNEQALGLVDERRQGKWRRIGDGKAIFLLDGLYFKDGDVLLL